jgi:hypothetical protein
MIFESQLGIGCIIKPTLTQEDMLYKKSLNKNKHFSKSECLLYLCLHTLL